MTLIWASLFIGICTTALFDLWGRLVSRLRGAPPPSWTLPGRWFAHLPRGTVFHKDIAQAAPVAGETALGWACHYLVGILYALLLLVWQGAGWLAHPTLLPALVVGIGTVLAGWLLFQPGLGLGIAAARQPDAWTIRGLNLAAHTVFGLGLWLFGLAWAAL